MFIELKRYREEEKEILSEIFRLIEEQTRALESRPCDSVAEQCGDRSDRIQNLLRQVVQHEPPQPH